MEKPNKEIIEWEKVHNYYGDLEADYRTYLFEKANDDSFNIKLVYDYWTFVEKRYHDFMSLMTSLDKS